MSSVKGAKLVSSLIEEQLNRLPNSPGVYLMRDASGNILYIGKAANLSHRVRSYFGAGQKLSPKLARLVAQVADIDGIYIRPLVRQVIEEHAIRQDNNGITQG